MTKIDHTSPRYHPGVRFDFSQSVDSGMEKYCKVIKNHEPLSVGEVAGTKAIYDWGFDGYNIPITNHKYKINNTVETL